MINVPGLEHWFAEKVRSLGVPGASASLVARSRSATLATGVPHMGQGQPVTADTIFQIASCSKAFTATALGILVSRGDVRFDDPVRRYLPEFTLDTLENTERATLRDLLGMRLGLEAIGACAWGRSRHVAHSTMFRRIAHLPRIAPIGQQFIYLNLCYTAIAEVIARVSGKPFSEFLKVVFEEFGLPTSFVEEGPMDPQDGIAVPHVKVDGQVMSISGNRSGGREGESCIYASAEGLVNWLKFHMGQSKTTLLSKEVRSELHTIQMDIPGSDGSTGRNGYCMGWMRGDHNGVPVLAHEGGELGSSSFAIFSPESQIGVSVLLNLRSGPIVRGLSYELFDRLSGRDEKDWVREFTVAEAAQEAAASAQTDHDFPITTSELPDLDILTGRYVSPHSGEVVLARDGDMLHATFSDMDVFNLTLKPLGGMMFAVHQFDEVGMRAEQKGRMRIRCNADGNRVLSAKGLGEFRSHVD